MICSGCKKQEELPMVQLSCGHSVHIGIREVVLDLSPQNPYFQIGKDFSCLKTLSEGNVSYTDFEENSKGSLICPSCLKILSEVECCLVLPDRPYYLEYGLHRTSSLALRQVISELVNSWSPEHSNDFAVKVDVPVQLEQSPNEPTTEKKVQSKPDMKMKGFDKIKSLIAFYKENPHPQMGVILTEAVFEANLKDAEQDLAFEMINKLAGGEEEEEDVKKVRTTIGHGVGYGGDAVQVLSSESDKRNEIRKTQLEMDKKVEIAMKKIAQVVKHGGTKLGVTTEAFMRREWGLLSAIAEHLRNGSLQDIVTREALYFGILDVCDELAANSILVALFLSSQPLHSHIVKWSAEAALALAKTRAGNQLWTTTSNNSTTTSPQPQKPNRMTLEGGAPLIDSLNALVSIFGDSSDPVESSLCRRFQSLLARIEESRHSHPHFKDDLKEGDLFATALTICSSETSTYPELNSNYKKVMKKYVFTTVNFLEKSIIHYFLNSKTAGLPYDANVAATTSASSSSKERQKAIRNTIANLKSSCPVEWYSSVFCVVDETRYDVISFLITGPDGTPYQNGCFHFDMYLPTDFPNAEPKAIFLTTGGGKVRFNPNLYADGKICLSLLGTWSGPKWNPKESTVLQVVLSIQSLILCMEPYYNEPGHESQAGTSGGQNSSTRYNMDIRLHTLRVAMLESIRNPPKAFESMVRDHFRLKRTAILKQCEIWRNDFLNRPDLAAYDATVDDLTKALNSLNKETT